MRGSAPRAGAVLYYVDPMHPWYRSERPGKAPDCGMDLEPVYGARDTVRASSGASANVIAITPDQERAAELQTEIVHPAPLVRELRTAGRVMPDEDLTFAVSAGVDGWVRRVFSDRTGTTVNRGDVLASFYSKEISAPQQAFVYALESYERLRGAPSPPSEPLALAARQLATARDNLLFVGMGETQIEELARARREANDIDLTAPAGGQILERRVAVGARKFWTDGPPTVWSNLPPEASRASRIGSKPSRRRFIRQTSALSGSTFAASARSALCCRYVADNTIL